MLRSAPVLDAAQVRASCAPLVDGVRVAPEVREYIADITRATREERMLSLGGVAARDGRAVPRGARGGACSRAATS